MTPATSPASAVPDHRSAARREPNALLKAIANYAAGPVPDSSLALSTARYCLIDALACAFLALRAPECTKLLGPVVPGAGLAGGARVPGTGYELDPVCAAFNIGTLVRWLDFNDTWLAAEWGHPSDNLGAVLAVADYVNRRGRGHDLARRRADRFRPFTVRDVLGAMIKAYEIQGVLSLQNSFNRVGLDHVLLVRIASTAIATHMLGGTRKQIIDAVSNAWLDGGALRAYRHAPNTGPRKSWAAGDATSRAVRLALLALAGEMGYPSALSAADWGFSDVLFDGEPIVLPRPLGSYVMENILFKVAYPAEFHAQTAVEAAIVLHPQVKGRIGDVAEVVIETQEPARRIIDKTGALNNPADRDHCIQYMVAVPLLFGRLTADDYEEETARDPRIDALRTKMTVRENTRFTRDYYDPDKRHIGNALQVRFADGSTTERVEVDCPIGHPRRRDDALPLLMEKFETAVRPMLAADAWAQLLGTVTEQATFERTAVDDFLGLLVRDERASSASLENGKV